MLNINEALKQLKEEREAWEIYDDEVFFPALEEASKKLGFELEGEANGEFAEVTTIFDVEGNFEPLNIEDCENKYKTKEELVKTILSHFEPSKSKKNSFDYKGIKVIYNSDIENTTHLKEILDNLMINFPEFFEGASTYEFRFEQSPKGGTLPDLIDGKPIAYTSDFKKLKWIEESLKEDIDSDKVFAIIECNWNRVGDNLSKEEKLDIMGYSNLEEFEKDGYDEEDIDSEFEYYKEEYDTMDSLEGYGVEILGSKEEGLITYYKVKLSKSNVQMIRNMWFVTDLIEIDLEEFFKNAYIDELLHQFA